MTSASLTPAAREVIDWLGDLGARWGLPMQACRVHGLLFLLARPVAVSFLEAELAIDATVSGEALAWLAEEGLVTHAARRWSTQADPWELMLHTLARRRAHELAPARSVLAPWRTRQSGEDPVVERQARRLLDLVEDMAAIDAGARRLSPEAMRRMVGLGGRAARLANRVFGGGQGK
jgi:DNA-binding transcriptional regulator GbsR (MarR family)